MIRSSLVVVDMSFRKVGHANTWIQIGVSMCVPLLPPILAVAVLAALDALDTSHKARGLADAAALIAQCISDRYDQITAKIVCGLAILIFDSVVTSAIAKLPILKFPIAV